VEVARREAAVVAVVEAAGSRGGVVRNLLMIVAALGALSAPVSAKQVVGLKRGHGMLAVRIVSNRAVSNYAAKWEVLVVRNIKSGRKFRLVDRYSGRPHHTYFVESLTAGEYQAFGVESFGDPQFTGFGTKQMVTELALPPELRFRIEADRLTNLGTLVFVRPYYPVNTEVYTWIVAPDADLPRRIAYRLEPAKVAALTEAPLGWTSIHDGMRIENLTPHIKQLSMFLGGLARTADGGRLAGEHFGQVAWRSPQGSWSWEGTGTVDTIAGVVEATDGTIYAVSENATLLRREGPGRWQRIDVPFAGEITCSLEAEPDGSLLMAWESYSSIAVLRYSPKDPSPWKVLRTIEFSPALVNRHIRRCVAWHTKASLMIVLQTPPLTKGESALDVLDRGTGQWTHYPEFKLNGATSALQDGSLVALIGPLSAQQFQVSRDFGKSWEVRAMVSGCGMPAFRTPELGFMMCTENLVQEKGSPPPQIAMWLTRDGGRKWERHADLAAGTSSLTLLEDPEMLFIHGAGKLFLSRDSGKTVTLERDSTARNWW